MSSVPSINKYYFIAGRGNFLVLASNNETRKAEDETEHSWDASLELVIAVNWILLHVLFIKEASIHLFISCHDQSLFPI
jgi:hypothetical protein